MANEIDIETEQVKDVPVPPPVTIEIAGKPYVFRWSKDYWWVRFYTAIGDRSQAGGVDAYKASMDLLEVSLDEQDVRDLEQRLRYDPDLDIDDLYAAILDLTAEWHEHVVERLQNLGVTIPEKVKSHMGKKSGKQGGGGKRVIKAPSRRR